MSIYVLPKSLTANSRLRYAVGAANTVIESQPGEGTLFPSSGTFYVVLASDDPARTEVVTVSARSTDAFTVTRGQFGTTAVAHPPGEKFELAGIALLLNSGSLSLPTGQTLDLPDDTVKAADVTDAIVAKAHLNSEVYAIENVCISGTLDNQTIKGLYRCWSACTVIRVAYFTSQAIDTSSGIDLVDGSTDGNGTDVIDSCADNLNGSDVNTLTTPYALSAGDYINLTVDDITNSTFISVVISLKVPLGAAT